MLGCSSSSVEVNNKEIFSPFESVDYNLYEIDDDKIGLIVYFSINGKQFFYKNNDNDYLASIEALFQIVDKSANNEVARELIEITLDKEEFDNANISKLYFGKVEFTLDNFSLGFNVG